MPTRLLDIFGSYDFYGKALPGMVFSGGILTLLPNSNMIPFSSDLAGYALFLFVIILVGALIGEAVHSLGIYIETMIAWLGRRIININDIVVDTIPAKEGWYQPYLNPEAPDKEVQAGQSLGEKIGTNWWYGIRTWVSNRLHGIRYTFIRHRSLFRKEMTGPLEISQYDPQERSRSDLDVVHQYLVKVSENEFRIKSREDAESVYPVITTILSSNGITRPDSFQARYSFCRSMWVTLFILILSYSFFPIWLHSPWILDEVESLTLFSVLFFFLLLFMISAGTYKKYYVEYLISGFYVSEREREIQGEDGERT